MNHVAVRVRDVKKAFHFYHEILKIPTVRIIGTDNDPRTVFLQGLELSQINPEERDVSLSHLGLEVSNIEEVYEELMKKGVVFDGPVRDVKFEKEKKAVKVAFFNDPDGNKVELVEWRNL